MKTRSKIQYKKTKNKKTTQKRSFGTVVFILILIALVGIILSNITKKNPKIFISSYDECVKSGGSQDNDTYPRQCKAPDKITYVESITNPIDTSTWKRFNTHLGFSFLCPPKTICSADPKNGASVYGIVLSVIDQANFQQSIIRHSGYPNPIAWYRSLIANEANAFIAPQDDIKPVWGTDGRDYPIYSQFDNTTTIKLTNNNWTGTEINEKDDSGINTYLLIPLTNQNLLLIYYPKNINYKDTIVKTILDSIELN